MKPLFKFIGITGLLLATTGGFAKTLNLYTEPRSDSKVSGNVNTENGVTIVYTPKTDEWIKIANPTNGDVGWIKSSDLGNNTYSMRMITSDGRSHNLQAYQFGFGKDQVTQQQLENEMRQFEHQQRLMQMHLARLFDDMMYFPQPVFVPVVLAPTGHEEAAKPSAKPVQTQALTTTSPASKNSK